MVLTFKMAAIMYVKMFLFQKIIPFDNFHGLVVLLYVLKDTGIISYILALQLAFFFKYFTRPRCPIPGVKSPSACPPVWCGVGPGWRPDSDISTPKFSFLWVCLTTTRYKLCYLTRIPARELVVEIEPDKVSKQLYFHAFTCDIVPGFPQK